MGYTNSPLVNYTKISPHRSSPRNRSIDIITPHCYVAQASVESMGNWFSQQAAKCSCNYGIGSDGRVALIVEEKDRSWCSSSSANDNRAVTIECASDTKEPYTINDKVYNKLIELMADICRRNGKNTLLWFGDKTRTLNYQPAPNEMLITVHRWYANKACPGNYIYNRLTKIAAEVTKRLDGKVATMYRVRLSWDKPGTQTGAFYDLQLAKNNADAHPGYSVYDEDGKAVYTSKADGATYTPETWIAEIAPIAQELAKKNAILPSVVIAQTALETGWGSTDLTQRHNIVGMKADLINNTWKDFSTWPGEVYRKKTPEYRGSQLVYVEDNFRVYQSFKQCLEDYEAFLLHVRNSKGLKYARIQGMRNPADVIHAIRVGTGTSAQPEGYCTDPAYETKILNLIEQYKLAQYDDVMPPAPEPVPPAGFRYRVQIEADKSSVLAEVTKKYVKNEFGLDCFIEKGSDGFYRVFCGSFENRSNAEIRKALMQKYGYEKAFIVTA